MIALLASPIARWLAGAAFVLAILASIYAKGKMDGRSSERQAAIVAAGKRIIEMEKNNEAFRTLPARDRCLAFMRDSGLPEHHCDQRLRLSDG